MKDFDGLLRSIGATESYNLPMPTDIRRRDLLRGASAATALSYSRILGANDKIGLGVIGCGERGRHDMSQFQESPKVDVTACLRHLRRAERQSPLEGAAFPQLR